MNKFKSDKSDKLRNHILIFTKIMIYKFKLWCFTMINIYLLLDGYIEKIGYKDKKHILIDFLVNNFHETNTGDTGFYDYITIDNFLNNLNTKVITIDDKHIIYL
jgi:hypothetical protein